MLLFLECVYPCRGHDRRIQRVLRDRFLNFHVSIVAEGAAMWWPRLEVSHESVYLHVHADKAKGGVLQLGPQTQKSHRDTGRAQERLLRHGHGDHQCVDQTLGIQTNFSDPYCSWQRGSNENFNGLLRQYIPKKRRMETVTDEALAMIENKLNHRPKKRLGFKTPHEVFHASLNRVALRP